jgi:hypothetical protein
MFDPIPFQEKITFWRFIGVLSQVFAVGLFSFIGIAIAIVGVLKVFVFFGG